MQWAIAFGISYPCSHSLKGKTITGLEQGLLKRLTEAVDHLESDAMGIYDNQKHHMVVVVVSRLM